MFIINVIIPLKFLQISQAWIILLILNIQIVGSIVRWAYAVKTNKHASYGDDE